MSEETQSSTNYEHALSVLAKTGVFKTDDRFRDGHTVATFEGTSIDITGSPLVQREVSEKDRMRLFAHLLAAAAERGLRPVELLAIGMATVLQSPETPS